MRFSCLPECSGQHAAGACCSCCCCGDGGAVGLEIGRCGGAGLGDMDGRGALGVSTSVPGFPSFS